MKFWSVHDTHRQFIKCDLYLKFAPWPNARACHYKLIYLFNRSRKYQSTHLRVLLQRRPKEPECSSVESEDHLEGEEVRDKGTENPCRWIDGPCWVRSPTTSTRSKGYWAGWTRRALPPERSSPNLQRSLGRGRGSYSFLTILY